MKSTETMHVASLWRYPVKSMGGEQLESCEVTHRGLVGDRAWALIDSETGRVVSAKNPRKWPNLLHFRARFVEPPATGGVVPHVEITTPAGDIIRSDSRDVDDRLSAEFGRPVHIASVPPVTPILENQVRSREGNDNIDLETLPGGTFFDAGSILILTTGMLDQLKALSPRSDFNAARFRPNILLRSVDTENVNEPLPGASISIGHAKLKVTDRCPRCVMTTLSQPGLNADPAILKTVVESTGGQTGVYAALHSGPCAVAVGQSVEVG